MTDEIKFIAGGVGGHDIKIEGKWANIKNIVRDLERDGWKLAGKYPEVSEWHGERLTVMEMKREIY